MHDGMSHRSDRQLRAVFFRSIVFVSSAAGIVLGVSEGQLFPAAVTPVVAVVGWLLVEHFRWLMLPVVAGNLLGLAAFGIAASEFMGGTLERKLLAGAHLTVYLTWIVLLLPKGIRQYWWLIALSVLQLSISGVLTTGAAFGAVMLGMMFLQIWTMSVFSLFRVQDQHQHLARVQAVGSEVLISSTNETASAAGFAKVIRTAQEWRRFCRSFLGLAPGVSRAGSAVRRATKPGLKPQIFVRNGLHRDASEVWIGWRFRSMVTGSYLVSLAIAAIVFVLFPRVWVPEGTLFGALTPHAAGAGSRVGFTETVRLGNIGQLMDNNGRVLTFEITDIRSGSTVTAEEFAEAMGWDEVRFRGIVLARYENGEWSRGLREKGIGRSEETYRFGDYAPLATDFRVSIVQDPPLGSFAFAPYPISREAPGNAVQVLPMTLGGSLTWSVQGPAAESQPRAFAIECPNLQKRPDATFEIWSTSPAIHPALQMKSSDRATLAELVYLMDGYGPPQQRASPGGSVRSSRNYRQEEDLRFRLPELYKFSRNLCTQNGRLVTPEERVRRVLRSISADAGFEYSRQNPRQDRSLDPVEDFLLNTKSGHCEHFATACTLMLQSVHVPARLVNGFYGSELNTLSGKYEVRQRHAHAWVEAFLNDRWQTLDPTPASQRREDVQRAEPVSLMTDLQNTISDFWDNGIHRMSAERQKQFLAPWLERSKSLLQSVQQRGLLNAIKRALTDFVKSPENWVSWQGGVVSFVMLLTVALLIRLRVFRSVAALFRSIRNHFSALNTSTRSVIRFYERFCELCEEQGLVIPPSNSALENARLAARTLESSLVTPQLRELPSRIAEAFNEVRFGNRTISEEQTASIGRQLTEFAEVLRASGTHPAKGVTKI